MTTFTITINGTAYQVEAVPEMPLLWVLRDLLELTGTKYSCGIGQCGACTVHLNGEAVQACRTPIETAAGQRVTTIEGLSSDMSHPLQQAWLAEQVPQCGYCQPGQIMAAAALLSSNPRPDQAEIEEVMSAVLCRCGTYQRIRRAILRAAGEGQS